MGRTMRTSILLVFLLGACAAAEETKTAQTLTAKDALAAVQPKVDCEWKAANRYDDGRYTIVELANRIMALCSVERLKARTAFHLPSYNPELELDDFKEAVKIVEDVRKTRSPR
jgi:hypothetical protein